jgi:hypothetical protein
MVVYLPTSVAQKQQKVANNGVNLRFFSDIANDCEHFCVKSCNTNDQCLKKSDLILLSMK